MNFSSKVLVSVITIAASGFGFASNAFAGTGIGGVAGSAAFDLDSNGNVTDVAVSAAVGKDTAYAGAVNDASDNTKIEAFAAGSGGLITLKDGSVYINTIAQDSARNAAQTNAMTEGVFDINATGAGELVDTDATSTAPAAPATP